MTYVPLWITLVTENKWIRCKIFGRDSLLTSSFLYSIYFPKANNIYEGIWVHFLPQLLTGYCILFLKMSLLSEKKKLFYLSALSSSNSKHSKNLLVFPIIIYFVVAIQYLKRKLTTGWPQLGVQTKNSKQTFVSWF